MRWERKRNMKTYVGIVIFRRWPTDFQRCSGELLLLLLLLLLFLPVVRLRYWIFKRKAANKEKMLRCHKKAANPIIVDLICFYVHSLCHRNARARARMPLVWVSEYAFIFVISSLRSGQEMWHELLRADGDVFGSTFFSFLKTKANTKRNTRAHARQQQNPGYLIFMRAIRYNKRQRKRMETTSEPIEGTNG